MEGSLELSGGMPATDEPGTWGDLRTRSHIELVLSEGHPGQQPDGVVEPHLGKTGVRCRGSHTGEVNPRR